METFLSEVSDVAHHTGERVETSLNPGFHMIVTVIVSMYVSLTDQGHVANMSQ